MAVSEDIKTILAADHLDHEMADRLEGEILEDGLVSADERSSVSALFEGDVDFADEAVEARTRAFIGDEVVDEASYRAALKVISQEIRSPSLVPDYLEDGPKPSSETNGPVFDFPIQQPIYEGHSYWPNVFYGNLEFNSCNLCRSLQQIIPVEVFELFAEHGVKIRFFNHDQMESVYGQEHAGETAQAFHGYDSEGGFHLCIPLDGAYEGRLKAALTEIGYGLAYVLAQSAEANGALPHDDVARVVDKHFTNLKDSEEAFPHITHCETWQDWLSAAFVSYTYAQPEYRGVTVWSYLPGKQSYHKAWQEHDPIGYLMMDYTLRQIEEGRTAEAAFSYAGYQAAQDYVAHHPELSSGDLVAWGEAVIDEAPALTLQEVMTADYEAGDQIVHLEGLVALYPEYQPAHDYLDLAYFEFVAIHGPDSLGDEVSRNLDGVVQDFTSLRSRQPDLQEAQILLERMRLQLQDIENQGFSPEFLNMIEVKSLVVS